MKSLSVYLTGLLALSPVLAAENEGFVFLDNLQGSKFPTCMETAMQKIDAQRKVVTASVFRDSLFPLFEVGTEPHTIEEMAALIKNPVVQQRIDSLGVRYVAVLEGNTTSTEFDGPITCGGGMGGGGCLGVATRDAVTQIEVSIWDLKSNDEPMKASGSAKSHDTMIALALPIPFIKNTRNPACTDAVNHMLESMKK